MSKDTQKQKLSEDHDNMERRNREESVYGVRRMSPDKKVEAYAELKTLYKDDKHIVALINNAAFKESPLSHLLMEIIAPKTDLFGPGQRGRLFQLAERLQKNETLPEEKRIPDLADLKAEYKGNDKAELLIGRMASSLPEGLIAREVREPQTNLFSKKTIEDYRSQYKM